VKQEFKRSVLRCAAPEGMRRGNEARPSSNDTSYSLLFCEGRRRLRRGHFKGASESDPVKKDRRTYRVGVLIDREIDLQTSIIFVKGGGGGKQEKPATICKVAGAERSRVE
jgi:hypothetical protein